jgi:hypothetical protein
MERKMRDSTLQKRKCMVGVFPAFSLHDLAFLVLIALGSNRMTFVGVGWWHGQALEKRKEKDSRMKKKKDRIGNIVSN